MRPQPNPARALSTGHGGQVCPQARRWPVCRHGEPHRAVGPERRRTRPVRRSDAPSVAADQGDAFSRAQAVVAGWTPRQVERRVDTGAWRRVVGRALTAEPTPDPSWRRGWAALLTWADGVVGLHTAAAILGFPKHAGSPSDRPAPVAVFTRSARRSCTGMCAVRRPLAATDVMVISGLVLTTPQRTAVDLLATLPWPQALDLFAWLTSRQHSRSMTALARQVP